MQLEKVILHYVIFGQLTQETILNIAEFRETTLYYKNLANTVPVPQPTIDLRVQTCP